jgi:hypothetical protein
MLIKEKDYSSIYRTFEANNITISADLLLSEDEYSFSAEYLANIVPSALNSVRYFIVIAPSSVTSDFYYHARYSTILLVLLET